MTVFNAKEPQPPRRKAAVQAIGLAVGLLAGLGAVNAAAPSVAPAALAGPAADPARQVAGALAVDTIDFKRGESGAGRLILRFSGDGAMPDLKTQGAQVLINVANAQLPANLQRPINVADFATPVERIEARPAGQGTQLVLATRGGYQSMAYQTGREYVVEIAPRAAAAAATAVAGAAAAANAPAAGSAPRYTGRPVTFNFQDVPVRTVLQLIAEESNLNIVASDTVQGNVTLRLINVPWDQALDIVLQAKGLDKRRSGSVVWVAPQSEIAKFEQDKEDARIALDNRVDLVTEYIQINYHNAAQIYKALTEAKGIGGSGGGNSQNESGFLSGRGRLVADERTNTLMISDIPKKVEAMKELIRVIDRPVDQVLIEARVVIASETFAREIGAKFGINGATGKPGDRSSLGFGSTTDVSGANASARAAAVQAGRNTYTATRGLNVDLPARLNDAAGSLALSILNAGYMLDLELSALQEEGRGEVISNPRIVTSNQREAVIRQGQEVGYVTITPSQGGGSIPIPNVQFKDVLLELKVTPIITSDGRVFLNMAVKKDEVIDFVDTSIGDVPLINKREVNTAVLVEDGQTVVVGGVYEFRDRSDLSKVPFLGDIPFLGNFFKKRGRSKEKAELLIFVTPKVMRVAQR